MSKHRATQACVCTKPLAQGAYLCGGCLDEVRDVLRDLDALAHALDAAYLRQQVFSVGSITMRLPDPDESGVPFREKAGRLRRELSRTLLNLVLTVDPHTPLGYHHSYDPTLPYPTTKAYAAQVLDRVDWLRTHPEGVEAHRDLTRLRARIHATVDRPPDLVYLGICSIAVEGEDCPMDLYAVRGKTHVDCPRCKFKHNVEHRRDVLLSQLDDQLAPAADIARGLSALDMHVTAERIRQWKRRKRLTQRNKDEERPLYRVGDVIDLVLNTPPEEEESA